MKKDSIDKWSITLINDKPHDVITYLEQELVQCKDCINRHDPINCRMYSEGMDTPDDWFCADGKRRLVNKNEV